MDNGTLLAGQPVGVDRTVRLRISAVVASLALVFAMFVVVQGRAEASVGGGSAAAAAVAAPAGDVADVAAQIDFSQIFCSILLTIFNAFSDSPFFSFIAAAIQPILEAFDCDVS